MCTHPATGTTHTPAWCKICEPSGTKEEQKSELICNVHVYTQVEHTT